MSLPRAVVAGQTSMVTRRCAQRQFLLLPVPAVTAILGYCLAVAAERYGVVIHAFCCLSNHVHLVVTDVHGNLPQFTHWFFEFTAKCLNAHWGRWENLWSTGRPSVVHLADEQAQLEKTVYAITNPADADLVTEAHHWPGLVSLPGQVGRDPVFKRPKGFFRENGAMPKRATLSLDPLPALAHLTPEAYIKQLSEAVVAREAQLAAERQANGRTVLGRRAILRQSHLHTLSSSEPRRQLNPRVACKDKWTRIEVLQRLREFVADYRRAWECWRDGDLNVMFPYGTYALRVHAGVRCLGPP